MTTFRNKFHPGQVIQHKRFDYRGVIVGVDQTFQLAEEWYDEIAKRVARVDDVEGAVATLKALDDILELQTRDSAVTVYVSDGGSRVAEVVRALDAAGISLHQLELSEPTLDQVFLKHTCEHLRVEEVAQPSRMVMGRRTR